MDRKTLINHVIDYMMEHLQEDLTLDQLAAQFYISKYHFCHMFKEETGESIYAFMKRNKIDQSAVDMKLYPTKPVTDIGLDYGYSSSNFSSAFKVQHHVSPTMFKASLTAHNILVPYTPKRIIQFQSAESYESCIQLRTLNDMFVLYERYIGNYINMEKQWFQFLDKHAAFLNKNTILIERFFHDPSITDLTHCIYDICITVKEGSIANDVMWIKGGNFIIYHFDGDMSDIYEALQGVFSIWLPQSQYTMIQPYGLNIYHSIDREHHRVKMDLCIPVA